MKQVMSDCGSETHVFSLHLGYTIKKLKYNTTNMVVYNAMLLFLKFN